MNQRVSTKTKFDPFDPDSLDHPNQLRELSARERLALLRWVADYVSPARRPWPGTSYSLKHAAEAGIGGYVPNGALKGALLSCGYEPINPLARNWRWRIRVTATAFNG